MVRRRSLLPLLALTAILAGARPAGAQPVPVSGRVTGEDGRPIAGTRLTLSRPVPDCAWTPAQTPAQIPEDAAPEAPAAAVAAGPDGRFVLPAPGPGLWLLTAKAPGHVPRERLLAPLLEPLELEPAVLPRDAGFTVQVAGPPGPPGPPDPIAARVLAVPEVRPTPYFSAPADPDSGWRAPARRAESAAGTVRLPWSTGERLRLAAAAPGLVPSGLAALEAWAAGPARLTLTAGPLRSVRALDERGSPVAGAVVCSRDGLALGRTDAEGRWSGAVPAAGSLALELRGPDGLQGSLRLAGRDRTTSRTTSPADAVARLRRPPLLAGRVVAGEERRPLAGALVWIEGEPEAAVRTGGDGGYALPFAAVGVSGYHLRAAAPGYLPAYALLAGPGRGPTLLLERTAAVAGVVVDGAGRPVAEAELALVPDPGQDREFVLLSGLQSRSGPDGRFRLTGAPARGRFALFCRKPGFAPSRVTLDLAAADARRPLRVVLAPGRSAVGRVVDPAGEPAAGARVALRPGFAMLSFSDPTGAEWTAEADAAGRFRLTGLPAGRYDLEAAAPGFARTLLPNVQIPAPAPDGPPGTAPAEVDLGTVALLPAMTLEGQVVDPGGKPLAGTGVEVMQLPLGLRRPIEPLYAATGPDGRFRLADLAPGYALHLTFRKPGYERRMVQEVTLPAAAPLRVVLAPAGRIRGRVIDAERQPVAGAQVLVESPVDGTAAQAPTDGAGEFEATEVAPGLTALHVQAAGYLAARLAGLEVPAGGELDGVEVVLERGAEIEGRLTDPRGRPVPGATVLARDASGGERLTGGGFAYGLSDGDGLFRISGVPVGLATLEAQHPRHGRARADLEVRPGTNAAALAFSPVFEVAGRVIDGDGRPVAGVNVLLQGAAPDGDLGGPSGAVTAEDGTFALPAVAPGSYLLLAVFEGVELASGLPVEVRDGPVSGLEVRIERGSAVLRGRLVGLAPEELAQVQVHASGEGRALLGWARPDGTYTVEGLAAGTWSVGAFLLQAGTGGGSRQARGEVEVPAGVAEATLDLVFEEAPEETGFTVTGLVRRAGAPVSDAMVVLEGRTARTDGAGAFRLEGVPAGSHPLVVQLQSGLVHQETLEVAADRSVVVEVAAGRLAGRVVEAADGRPLAGAQVRWQPLDGLPAGSDPATFWGGIESDARGLFFAEVAPGRFRVVAERRGYAAAEAVVEVEEGAASEVEIRLEPAEVLVLAVAHADGRPLAQVTLAALDGAGRVVASGRFQPGAAGRVRVSTVPAGTWQLLAVADGSGTAGLVTAVPGEAGPLVLPPAGSLIVHAPELAGQAAVLTLTDAAGRPVQLLDEWSEQVAASWPLQKGAAALGGVAAGRYAATVTAGDGRIWSKMVDVAPGGQAALTLP